MTPIDDARATIFMTAMQLDYVMRWAMLNAEKIDPATHVFLGMSMVQIARWADIGSRIISDPTTYHPLHPRQRSIFY